jgi:hypothetical protein
MRLNKRVLLLVSIVVVVMLDGCYRYPGRRGGHRYPRREAAAAQAPSMR